MKRNKRDDSFLNLIVSKHTRHSIWLKSLTVAASMVVVAAVVLMAQPASALADATELGIVAEQSAEDAEPKDTVVEVQEADADTGSQDADTGSVNAASSVEEEGSADVSPDANDDTEDASVETGAGSEDEGDKAAEISESGATAETGGSEIGESQAETAGSEDPEDIDASDHSADAEETTAADDAAADAEGSGMNADVDGAEGEAVEGEITDGELEAVAGEELPLELDELEIATPGDFPLELELPLEIEYASGTLVYNGDDFYVELNYTEDAKIPGDSVLEVTQLTEDSDEFADAKSAVVDAKKEEDEEFDEASLGFTAIDITIKDPDGEIIEPETGVSVRIEMKQLPEDIDHKVLSETLEVQHLNESTGETVVETVAQASDVTVVDTSAIAEFDVESFSVFTLTWTTPTPGGSATIHWGEYVDGEFTEFTNEHVATLDTTAASVSLNNTFDGYSYYSAYYVAPGSTDEIDIEEQLIKTGEGWQMTQIIHNDDETTTTQTAIIADGSDIYACYAAPVHHDPTPSDIEVPKPKTEKSVVVNDDGTATITLDVTGTAIEEVDSVGANVLVVLDTTYSMASSMSGAANRFEAARSAILTLIDTLEPSKNDIDFALVEFNSVGEIQQSWTKDHASFRDYIANTAKHADGPTGTNWESGLYYARQALNSKDKDATYVIFLTDGEPNRRGTTTSTNAGTSTAISYALTQAQAITGTSNTSLYGVFCGSASGYNNLYNMIYNAGGVETINGTDADAIEEAFKGIAHTIVTNLGAGGVVVDDGITDLSSVSATVSGTAGGYKYFYNTHDPEEWNTWAEAPGASYSEDNGVTWDLSAAGTLPAGTTYRIQFTVWPSQEALDLIANLNNGTVKYADLTDDVKAQITGDETSGYTLATNTHLNTTYSFQGNTYTDPITPLASGDMPLQTELMTVEKQFAHTINSQDPFTSIVFYLKEDGKYYQTDGTTNETLVTEGDVKAVELPVNTGNDWKNQIYVAPGFIQDGEVLEKGHKYSLEEKVVVGNEYEYEFTPQTVRPMIIDGKMFYLVLEDKYNSVPSGADTYTIDGETYFVAANNNKLVGTNRKTAELDITVIVDDPDDLIPDAQEPEETFTYRVTLNIPDGTDPAGIVGYEYVVRDTSNAYYLYGYHEYEGGDPAATAFADDIKRLGNNKYRAWNTLVYRDLIEWENIDGKIVAKKDAKGNIIWKVPAVDGYHTIAYDMTMKQNEVIRFTNLPSGTTYTIQEIYSNKYPADNSASSAGRKPVSDPSNVAEEGYTISKVQNTAGSVSGDTVSGTIEDLDIRYYNQFTNTLSDTVDMNLAGTKALDGYEWSGESYQFKLTANEGTPLPSGASGKTEIDLTAESGAASQTNTFGHIRFTQAGTYTYTVEETNAGTVQVVGSNAVKFGDAVTITVVVGNNEETKKLVIEEVTGTNVVWDGETSTATVTITNSAAKTEVSATKAWVNADGTSEWPKDSTGKNVEITFSLLADGVGTDKAIALDGLADENGEKPAKTATFSGLPKFKVVEGKAVEIVYTVKETGEYQGYTASPAEPIFSGGTITNTQETTTVTARKAWVNLDGSDTPPKDADGNNVSVEFTLFADDVATAHTVVLDGTKDESPKTNDYESAAWEATFDKLPKYKDGTDTEIKYTVKEAEGIVRIVIDDDEIIYESNEPAEGVENEGTITNIAHPAEDVLAIKAWKNADGTTTPPKEASVAFTLLRDGTRTKYVVTLNGDKDDKPVGMGGYESSEWTASFVKMPKYKYVPQENGSLKREVIEYTVEEITSYPGYTASPTSAVKNGETITNIQDEIKELKATKAWLNADGSTNPPEGASVVFTLHADGVATKFTATLDGTPDADIDTSKTAGYESEAWKASFVHLPKYQAGTTTEIVYTVKETTGFEGYTADGDPASDGGSITNKQETVDVKATKAWLNADGSTNPPAGASVVFTLYEDGAKPLKTVTLDGIVDEIGEAASWVASFNNLPKYRYEEEGGVLKAVEIKYTVDETTPFRGYEKDNTEAVSNEGTITNKQVTAKLRLLKIGDSDESIKLTGVEFKLYSDEEMKNQITVDAAGKEIGKSGLITTGTDGTAELGTFAYGTYYLKETKNKDGYKLLEDPVMILVNPDGTVEYRQEDYKGAEIKVDEANNTFIITVDNKSGAQLPSTGGIGTGIFRVIGSLMIAFAGIWLFIRRRCINA